MISNTTREHVELNCRFLQPARLEANIRAVVSYAGTLDRPVENYWNALQILQSADTGLPVPDRAPALIWYKCGQSNLDRVLANLMDLKPGEPLTGEREFSERERAVLEPVILRGLDLAETLFPEIYGFFRIITPYILLAKCNGIFSGSVAKRLGFIWLSPLPEWDETEAAEHLFHEFIHNALFLEEMVHPAMPFTARRMEEDDGLVRSAIKQVKRGYDKAFHAAFVAYGLMCFYLRLGMPDNARVYLNPLLLSLDEMVKNQKFLSPDGVYLLDELCANVLEKRSVISYPPIPHPLPGPPSGRQVP